MLGSETRNVDHLQGAHSDFRSGAGGEYECMKDAAILVTSLLQFQLEGRLRAANLAVHHGCANSGG